jgi:hypothetical protein
MVLDKLSEIFPNSRLIPWYNYAVCTPHRGPDMTDESKLPTVLLLMLMGIVILLTEAPDFGVEGC